jgi:hypothetical protein
MLPSPLVFQKKVKATSSVDFLDFCIIGTAVVEGI